MRHKDQSAIDYVLYERDRCCIYGLMSRDPCQTAALHVHHIEKRSQFGPDHPDNLITLCAYHHEMAERHQIHPQELIDMLKRLGSYSGDFYGMPELQEKQFFS